MIEEKLAGKPKPQPIPYNEKLGPSPMTKQTLPQPEGNAGLMSQANQEVEKMTAKPTSVRHPLGRGVPKDHPALEGME